MSDKVFDWQGTEVKEGMTIYFVQTKPSIMESGRAALLMPDTRKLVYLESEEDVANRINREVWELGEPYEVIRVHNRLYAKFNIKDDPDIESFSFPIINMFWEKPTIAIKGVSDKK